MGDLRASSGQKARDARPNSLQILRDRIRDLKSASRPDDLESDERVRELVEVHDLVRAIMKARALAVMLYVDTGEYRRVAERSNMVCLTRSDIGGVHGRLAEMLRTVDRLAVGLGIGDVVPLPPGPSQDWSPPAAIRAGVRRPDGE